MTICEACGLRNPTPLHDKRRCDAMVYMAKMEAFGYARLPARCVTRAFREAGVQVYHGPVSTERTGNWIQKPFLVAFLASCKGKKLRGISLRLQVHKIVLSIIRDNPPPSPPVPLDV